MAINRKTINYPCIRLSFDSDRDACWDIRDARRARLLAKRLRIGSRLSPPPRKRSEGETTADCRSTVVVGVIGDARFMRNGDGQTAAHPGIRNSRKTVETLGEVMIRIERHLVEAAR